MALQVRSCCLATCLHLPCLVPNVLWPPAPTPFSFPSFLPAHPASSQQEVKGFLLSPLVVPTERHSNKQTEQGKTVLSVGRRVGCREAIRSPFNRPASGGWVLSSPRSAGDVKMDTMLFSLRHPQPSEVSSVKKKQPRPRPSHNGGVNRVFGIWRRWEVSEKNREGPTGPGVEQCLASLMGEGGQKEGRAV